MIMKTFPKKLPSKIKQNAKSLKIRPAEESTMMHVEFCWPRAVELPIREMVEFDVSSMIAALIFKLNLLSMPTLNTLGYAITPLIRK